MRSITNRRVARKAHSCDCGQLIEPGHVYLEHTEFPGGDAGYADHAGHPVRLRECAPCAVRYGRDNELGEIPSTEQLYGQGLA